MSSEAHKEKQTLPKYEPQLTELCLDFIQEEGSPLTQAPEPSFQLQSFPSKLRILCVPSGDSLLELVRTAFREIKLQLPGDIWPSIPKATGPLYICLGNALGRVPGLCYLLCSFEFLSAVNTLVSPSVPSSCLHSPRLRCPALH